MNRQFRRSRLASNALAGAATAALAAGGGLAPRSAQALEIVSPEVLVSSSTSFDDAVGPRSVGISETGEIVIVWNGRSTAPPPGDVSRVYARRYDDLGAPQGSPTTLDPISFDPNDPDPADRRVVSFSMNDQGEFAASWAENFLISTQVYQQTYARWFDDTGGAETGAVPVAVQPNREVYQTDIALGDDGRTVVAWSGYFLSNRLRRQFRVYPTPGGLPPSGEVTILEDIMPFDDPGRAFNLETWIKDDGSFVTAYRTRAASDVVRLRPYEPDGLTFGTEIVAPDLPGGGVTPLEMTGDGHLLGVRFAEAGPAIFAKVYDPDFNQLVDSDLIPNSQFPIAFAADRAESGEFTVVFLDQIGGLFEVFIRSYDRNGNPQTGVTSISEAFIPSIPSYVGIDLNEQGQAVVSWTVPDFPENPSPGVYLRTFTYNRTPNAVVSDGLVFSAEADCTTTILPADLDAGSNDPDGLPSDLEFSISPAGPFGLGEQTVTFTVTDLEGASDSTEVTFTIVDDLPPLGLNSVSAGGPFINTTNPLITWSVASDCQMISYDLQAGTTPGGSDVADVMDIAATSTNVTFPGEGEYHVQVAAEDASGNNSGFTASTSFVIDLTPPTTPGDPTTDVAISGTSSVLFDWTASTDANFAAYDVQIGTTPGGSNVFNGTAASPSILRSFGADGTYFIRVRGRDLAGNVSDWSGNGQVTVDTTLPTRPGIPLPVSPLLAQLDVELLWDASSDANLSGYELRVGTAPGGTNIFNAIVPPVAMTNVSVPGDDVYYTRVRALDAAGNVSSFSNIGNFEVDTTGPTAPGAPQPGASPTDDPAVTFAWTAANDANAIANYEFQLGTTDGGADVVDTTTGTTLSFSPTLPADGEYFARVRAIDELGNEGAWSPTGSVLLDATGPMQEPGSELDFSTGSTLVCSTDVEFTVTFNESILTIDGPIVTPGLTADAISLASSTVDTTDLTVEVTGTPGSNNRGPYTIRVFGSVPDEGDLIVTLDGLPLRDNIGNLFDPTGISATATLTTCDPDGIMVY